MAVSAPKSNPSVQHTPIRKVTVQSPLHLKCRLTNEVIMENIAEAETSIEAILLEKHDAVLGRIQTEADALGSDCEYSITDEFADQIIYESALIISQFCASQEDFREVKLAVLEGILRRNTDGIFPIPQRSPAGKRRMKRQGETHTIYHYVVLNPGTYPEPFKPQFAGTAVLPGTIQSGSGKLRGNRKGAVRL